MTRMYILAIALELLLVSCAGSTPTDVEPGSLFAICGFGATTRPESSGDLNSIFCPDVEAQCPASDARPASQEFCTTKVASTIGFDFSCAPNDLNTMCESSACNGKSLIASPGVDWPKMCDAIDWAILAYQSPEVVTNTLQSKGISGVTVGTSQVGSLRYFHYSTSDLQWLVFRGTELSDLCNDLTDARSSLLVSPILDNLRFHSGFYQATLSALSAITLDKNKPLHLTGHSLGGAAALVAGMVLKRQGYQVASVTTFGQPHVLDKDSVNALPADLSSLPLIRVINAGDLVPYMFWLVRLTDPYTHFGPELHVGLNTTSPGQFAYLESPTGAYSVSKTDHDHCTYQKYVHAVSGCTSNLPCQ